MINLRHEVEAKGYTVVHCKTDSIKIANPDNYIYDFVMAYGKIYGYNFEVEHKFEKICLVNDAVYIAKLAYDDPEDPGKWTATGTQFAVPYVFKTLFSHDALEFGDFCETKSVKNASIYLDMNEQFAERLTELEAEKKSLERKQKKGIDVAEDLIACNDEINKCHSMIFVGKVGLFCPIKNNAGGGTLLAVYDDGRVNSVSGTKGYRWLEAEAVKASGLEASINTEYYETMADKAIETISKYGDFYSFAECVDESEAA